MVDAPDGACFTKRFLDLSGGASAKTVALFCNGPRCGQSPTAIRKMIAIGYPPENVHYCRQGMQMLGLSVAGGN